MTVVSIDALARRRALVDKMHELEDAQRRLGRMESALCSLQQVLHAVPDPVEVIGENLLVQYANQASLDIHGETVESKPYYSALLGLKSPPEDCPVQAALREGMEMRTEIERDGVRVEIVLVPTTLSGGQRAVVRTTRPLGTVLPGPSNTSDASRPPVAGADDLSGAPAETETPRAVVAFREIEWLRRMSLACVGPTRTSAMLEQLLPVITEAFAAAAAMYYHGDERAKRYVRLGVAADSELETSPAQITGFGYADLERAVATDVPFVHVTDMSLGSALPEALHDWSTSCGIEEIILVPVTTARARHGALVIALCWGSEVIPGPQDQLLRAIPEIIGTAIERNVVLRTIERAVSALLDT